MMTSGQSLINVTEDNINKAIQKYRAKTGRPSMFTDDIAAEIIERLMNGETLRGICSDPRMPSNPTVYDWMEHSVDFASAIARARRRQATVLVEEGREILDKADDSTMPQVQKADKRAQFRFQMAKCFDRDTFGDKVQQDVNLKGVVITTQNDDLNRLLNE